MKTKKPLSVAERWRVEFAKQPDSYTSALHRDAAQVVRVELQSYYMRRVLEYAQLSDTAVILEPGCGSGRRSVALGTMGYRVVFLDYTPQMLFNARQLAGNAQVGWSLFVQGDLESLPFEDDTFDMVFNEGVVEHWLDTERRAHVFREMARTTKPGGTVSIVVPHGKHPLHSWWRRHGYPGERVPMHYYGPDNLAEELRRAGLQEIEVGGSEERPWSIINHWPRKEALRLIAFAAHRLLPVPAALNTKLNINLLGLGRKPSTQHSHDRD